MTHHRILKGLMIAGFVLAAPMGKAAEAPTIEELENLAAKYEHKLARIRSHNAILNLQAAYGYYIDKGLWDEAAALFAADGTFEYGQRGVYEGPARIREALGLFGPQGLKQGQLNNRITAQPIVDVAPDNQTAEARWRVFVQKTEDGDGRWGAGVYKNDYVNVNGTWKIQSLHYYVTMKGDYEEGWAKVQYPMEGPSEEVPPDRPPTEEYEALPGVYVPAYHYDHPVTGEPVLDGEGE